MEKLFHKKNPKAFFCKMGWKFPVMQVPKNKTTYWIHSVSLGETKAASSLIQELRLKEKDCWILQSTVTDTGYEQAKKNQVDSVIYMPFDFAWLMKTYLQKVQPECVYIIENDLWPNFLKIAKKIGSQIILKSGSLSDRSFRRLSKVPMIARWLYRSIDCIEAQSEESFQRFARFVPEENLKLGLNLKQQLKPSLLDKKKKEFWMKKLFIRKNTLAITCTHEKEEKLLLSKLLPKLQKDRTFKVLLAPRHPDRFDSVAKYLETLPVSFSKLSNLKKDVQILLIDRMGFLPTVYQCSKLAILAGSFIPNIGGHNLLEPISYQIPVLFGPYMDKQKSLVQEILFLKKGVQTSLENLLENIEKFL